jgi:hypothetical protein
MDFNSMCPNCIPDPLSLLWKEGGGKNEIDVMPSNIIELSQVLEFFNIRIWVSGERAKALFYLREVSKGKGDMDPHNAFCSIHLPERVDGNWLTGGSVRARVWGALGILWFWMNRRMVEGQAEGEAEGGEGERVEGGGKGWKEGWGKGGRRGRSKGRRRDGG